MTNRGLVEGLRGFYIYFSSKAVSPKDNKKLKAIRFVIELLLEEEKK